MKPRNIGERVYNARLTAETVAEDRAAYRAGGTSVPKLAAVRGVSVGAMYCALAGVSWGHVPGALGWGFAGRATKKTGGRPRMFR